MESGHRAVKDKGNANSHAKKSVFLPSSTKSDIDSFLPAHEGFAQYRSIRCVGSFPNATPEDVSEHCSCEAQNPEGPHSPYLTLKSYLFQVLGLGLSNQAQQDAFRVSVNSETWFPYSPCLQSLLQEGLPKAQEPNQDLAAKTTQLPSNQP